MGDRFSAVYVRTDLEGIRAIAIAVQEVAIEFKKPTLSFGKPMDVEIWAARNSEVLNDGWCLEIISQARNAGATTAAFIAKFSATERNAAVKVFLKQCGGDPNFAMAGVASNLTGTALYFFNNDTLCSSGHVEMQQGAPVRASAYGLGGSDDLVGYSEHAFSVEKRSLQSGDFSYEEPACDALARSSEQPRGTAYLYDRLLPQTAPETIVFKIVARGQRVDPVLERAWTPDDSI